MPLLTQRLLSLSSTDALKNGKYNLEDIGNNMRRMILLVPLALGIAAAVIPLLNASFNFSGVYSCSIAPYPIGCGTESGIQCIRGAHAHRTVGWITFLFNTIAYIFALFAYYTERNSNRHFFESCPVVALNLLFLLSSLVGSVCILRYRNVSIKLFEFYLSVTITPLTGLFLAIIYFYPSRSSFHLDKNFDRELSEPFILPRKTTGTVVDGKELDSFV